jgi:hypothetical protein
VMATLSDLERVHSTANRNLLNESFVDRLYWTLGNQVCIPRNASRNLARHSAMSFLINTVKRILFWSYPRTSWQWDMLCVLILVFIFLTPKSWFENTHFRRSHIGQTTIVLAADIVGVQADRAQIEQQARSVAGRADAQVTAVRERRDGMGRLIAYEVDIR